MIVRELTTRGAGGVSVLELRGARAREALGRLWPPAVVAPPGALRVARLELDGEPLDEALVWVESVARIELHLHGSPPLVAAVISQLQLDVAQAHRPPERLEVRAANALASAVSEPAARMLLDQEQGALRRECEELLGSSDIEMLTQRLERLVELGRQAVFASTPTRVAIVGAVNAGKSTLFNALLGAERAIVSAHAGATRDALVEAAQFGEWPVELVDTAGERDLELDEGPAAGVERAGQELARAVQGSARWTLRLVANDDRRPASAARPGEVRIVSCADRAGEVRPQVRPEFAARISVARDREHAVKSVHDLFHAEFDLPRKAWTSGAAVPFDAWSRRAVATALAAVRAGDAGWRRELLQLLERTD